MSQQEDDTKWVQPEKVSPFDLLIDRLENIRDLLEKEKDRLEAEVKGNNE